MPTAISLRLPFETGTRLQNLADTLDMTVTDTVAMLLDHAARTGLGTLALPGIDIKAENGLVSMRLDDFAVRPFSSADARSTADGIRKVSRGAGAHMNMDCPDWIKITRAGQAVVIEALDANGATLQKMVARGVAKSVADRLEQAAAELLSGADLSVEELLGDLELGGEEGSDEVVEHIGELDVAD